MTRWLRGVTLSTSVVCLLGWMGKPQAQEPQVAPPPPAEPAPEPSGVGPDDGVGTPPEPAPAPAASPQPSAAEHPASAPSPPATVPSESAGPPAPSRSEPPVAYEYRAVGIAPAPGASVALAKLPNNVQYLDASELVDQHALSLSDALNAKLGSVTINDVQNNPLQPDLQYRGFTSSPLIGTPQGMSVFQNGVRLNEPFGDVLQWDLIPLFAIADAAIVPGDNPVYGLNTLGGSLVLHMKDGFAAPGYRIEGSAGSFARYRTTLEYGHADADWAAYVGASLFAEEGFRDKSRTGARNLYADLRRRNSDYELGVGLTLANTSLNGNGPTPIGLLHQRRAALYTWPDNTQNELVMLSVDGQKRLGQRVALQGTTYLRHGVRATSNGDATDFGSCVSASGEMVVCSEDAAPLQSRTGMLVPAAEGYDAVFNTTHTVSNGFGASLQLSVRKSLFAHPNQFVIGTSYDGSQNAFTQRTELGRLTSDRGVDGGGPSLDGPGLATDLFATNHMLGAYALETWSATDEVAIHLSGRFNWFNTKLDDRLGDDLDGNHSFARFNPALGLTARVLPQLTLFASYGESNRAPSAAELACADPDQPCRLPNAFISDPPLKQVVSRSAEIGWRGHVGPAARPLLRGSVAAFGSRNFNDILFVAGSHAGTGYFRNAGTTQRLGIEAALAGDIGPINFYASYTLLRATFESELRLPRNAGSDADDPDDNAAGDGQEVEKGSRIPGLPMHAVKAGISWRVFAPFELGLSMLGQSTQPFRGDESNAGPFVHGYMILNAQASYRLLKELSLFVRAQNLLDARYETFGLLANASQVLPGMSDPRFLGPGAPFGIWAGAIVTNL